MKHLTMADKSLLVGDQAADLLIEYATLLGQHGSADSVELRAISSDGDEVLATFLLNSGLSIVSETTTSSLPEPDNERAEDFLSSRILHFREMRGTSPEDVSGEGIWNSAEQP